MEIKNVHVGSRTYLPIDEIEFIKADFSYSLIFLKNGKSLLVSTNIQKLQQRFGENMIRVHRSFLINPRAEIQFGENDFISKNGHKGLISRRLKKNLNF